MHNMEIEEDVNENLSRVDEMENALGVIYNRKLLLKFERKVYYTSIRPTILYGIEC